jgi:quercetin dioxygenase-like cupin family protein
MAITVERVPDLDRNHEKLAMGGEGIVVRPGEGLVQNFSPGRFPTIKLLGRDTADSVMLFEETTPCGTKSWFHLHRDSDEIAYVLSGEVTSRS